MKKPILVLLAVIATLTVLAVACGGDGEAPTVTPTLASATATPTTDASTALTRSLAISVNGNDLQYDKDRLEVAAGTEVVLVFDNVSIINQHNLVIVRAGTKDGVASRGIGFPDDGWVQPEDPDVIARTDLLDTKESGEVRFAAPSAGAYEFVCTFPAHNLTMFGDFVVTP